MNMYAAIRIVPPVRDASMGQTVAPVLVASCMRMKYKPNPMPASRGSFKSERWERISFTPPSLWETSQTAARANPKPMKVSASGKPSLKEPTTTGSNGGKQRRDRRGNAHQSQGHGMIQKHQTDCANRACNHGKRPYSEVWKSLPENAQHDKQKKNADNFAVKDSAVCACFTRCQSAREITCSPTKRRPETK